MRGVSVLGTLADGVVGAGGARGLVGFETAGIEIDWWIGHDDGWTVPATDGAHTIRPGAAPAIESRVRVPGGEAVLRAYAVAVAGAPIVVCELENSSPGPLVVAWVVRGAPGYKIGRVALEGSTLVIDERARIELPRVPTRWAAAPRAEGVRDAVVGGNAASGPFEPVATRRGDLEVAVLFPIAHRTRTRVASSIAGRGTAARRGGAPLASLADVERGWAAALEVGMQAELPDQALQGALRAARAATLLLGTVGGGRDRVVGSAARAWGFTTRADRSRTRPAPPGRAEDPWAGLRADSVASGSSPREAARWLGRVRDALVRVERDGFDVLPHFPVEWLGLPIAVQDAPTADGLLSFALRWHGARPALLWDAPAGRRVRATALDPAWEGIGSDGEALLAEIDATRLLPLGSVDRSEAGPAPGVILDDPGSFT